ncbi:hypothetical protein HJFPF1_11852 [Paramyrothecium foliicola]|nr:hypothetical protein HJFPF1_11852 [Paramyrothecium foliicola]
MPQLAMRLLNIITYVSSAMGMAISARTEPANPAISAVTHSGNGCPQDSDVEVFNGGRSFKIHDFSAKAPGVDTTQNCALHFNVAGVAGWQVSVKHATVRAYAQIPLKAGLNYWFTYFWSDDADNTSAVSSSWTNEEGAVNGQLVLELDVPESKRAWSRCGKGGILNPNFRAAIVDQGYFGTRGQVVTTETLTYAWREC